MPNNDIKLTLTRSEATSLRQLLESLETTYLVEESELILWLHEILDFDSKNSNFRANLGDYVKALHEDQKPGDLEYFKQKRDI